MYTMAKQARYVFNTFLNQTVFEQHKGKSDDIPRQVKAFFQKSESHMEFVDSFKTNTLRLKATHRK